MREIRDLFWQAGFNCRQFLSNERREIAKLPTEWQETKEQVSLLGVQWNTINDELVLKLPRFESEAKLTKRMILSHVASVYDPCGLISPALLKVKNVQVKIWSNEPNAKWDDPVSEESESEFCKVVASWDHVEFRFPRRNFKAKITSATTLKLDAFADASRYGIGLAIYLRSINGNYRESSLIFARSLVVPTTLRPKPTKKGVVKEVLIPRLELHATYLLAKAVSQLIEFLQTEIEAIQLWTDSSTVIHWLRARETKEVFIRNRLPLIRKFSVQHVGTCDNPADIASRGIEPKELSDSTLWWNGPSWLSQTEDYWPASEFKYLPGDEQREDEEDKLQPFHTISCNVVVGAFGPKPPVQNGLNLFNLSFSNDLYRIKRVVVYVLRFVNLKIWNKIKGHLPSFDQAKDVIEKAGSITANELDLAEKVLILEAQRTVPPDETTTLNLGLYKAEMGILRCKGRLEHCDSLLANSKHPIFLPYHSPLSQLILRRMHWMLHHCGPGILIAEYRKCYWTPALRKLIKNCLYVNKETKCLPCAMMRARPFAPPPEPPLPTERVNVSRPFEHCGIDYFGPYRLKSFEEKCYGLIFSCMTTRAIHLEMTSSLSADKTMLAMRRFISRRGCPGSVLSDNAKQFQLVKSTVEQQWQVLAYDEKLSDFVTSRGIKWVHTTERAPWRGSIYERLIGSVKYCLKRTLGRRSFEREELYTILIEVELIVNSRPLTTQTENEITSVLKPIDFLLPQGSGLIVNETSDIDPDDPDFLLPRFFQLS